MAAILKAIKAYKDPTLPENYFRLEVNILRTFGFEMFNEETWAYTIFSRLTLFVMVYVFTFIESCEVYYQWGELDSVVDVMTYWFTHFGGVIKVTLLFFNRKKFGKILKLFHTVPFAPNNIRGGSGGIEAKYIRDAIKFTETQMLVYIIFVSFTLLAGGVRCIYARLTSERDDWLTPFSTVKLLESVGTPFFELGSLYQFINVTLYAVVIATIDVLICCIMAQLSAQFKILHNAFKTLRSRSELMKEKDPEGRSESECVNLIVGEYIDHHCKVLELAVDLEELLNLIVLGATFMDTVLLCFLLYECSQNPPNSAPFLQSFCYYWNIVTQVSVYCYWGNEVTAEAENLATAAGMADWPGAPLSVQKSLVMVIARSQKPLYMTIGKFLPLSLTTLMSLLKASFSYFTVMSQTKEEE